MRRPRGDHGTSTLELVGVLPVVAVVVVALMQGGVAAYAVASAQTAARNAALASSRGDDPQQAAERAVPSWLDADPLAAGTSGTVAVTIDIPDLVPAVDLRVRRSAVFPAAVLP